MSLEQNVITTKGMMKDVATTSVTLTGAWWVEGGGPKTGCPLHGRCGEGRGLVNILQSKKSFAV